MIHFNLKKFNLQKRDPHEAIRGPISRPLPCLGVERYKIVASFDRDTCALCGALDGKVFGMPDYQEGLTAPPFHPWCCTCPCFEDMEKLGERWARSPDGTTGRVPADMSFEEWKRQLVQGIPRPKDVLTEYIQKAIPGQGLITYDAACNASQIKSRCSRLTRLASSWYSSLIVVGLMPVTLASSACVQRISPSFLDSKILIILCVAPLCDKITRIWPTCLAFVRLSRNGLFRAISLRI